MAGQAPVCALCNAGIQNYNPILNRLALDGGTVHICQPCVDKFLKWQQGIFATLFPTKSVKRFRK